MDNTFWQAVMDADYAVPAGHSATELFAQLMQHLGSTDSWLRDDVAYGISARWLNRQLLAPDEVRPWVEPLAANLEQGLGEQGTDTVFLRSFSVLMLAAVVYYDNNRHPFLSVEQFRALFDQALSYFVRERDCRGFVPGCGWAHTVAHAADLLDEFAASRYAQTADLERILTAFSDKVTAPSGTIFLYNEDDRMTYGVLTALKRNLLSHTWVDAWLARLGTPPENVTPAARLSDPALHSAYLNTKNFLRSLYVRLLGTDVPASAHRFVPETRAALLNLR